MVLFILGPALWSLENINIPSFSASPLIFFPEFPLFFYNHLLSD